MNIQPIDRDYRMSDAELILFASNLVGFMTRDITEFGTYSITSIQVSELAAKEDEFEAYPSDTELKADMMIAVEDKDASREALLLAIRQVSETMASLGGKRIG